MTTKGGIKAIRRRVARNSKPARKRVSLTVAVQTELGILRNMVEGVANASATIQAEFRRRIERLESGKPREITKVKVICYDQGTGIKGRVELTVDGFHELEDGVLQVMCSRPSPGA